MKENTRQRETRQRAEDYAAKRAAITPMMMAEARVVATAIVAGNASSVEAEYGAGEALVLTAGTRRTIKVDEGALRQLALSDAIAAAGWPTPGHFTSFGLFAGRSSIVYGLRLR